MTTVKVLRSGDGLGVVLPPEVVERLALHDGDELSVTEANGRVELQKRTTVLTSREREAVDYVLTHHARTLELLAKR